MSTGIFVRSLLALAAGAALSPLTAGQADGFAHATFKQAVQQHAAGVKADFTDCVKALRADLDELVAGLKDGTIPPPDLPDELTSAFAQAFESGRVTIMNHVAEVDAVGTFLHAEQVDADPDAVAPPALVIGADSVVDDFHDKLQSALTSLDKSFAKELRRALLKIRKLLPATTIVTGQLLPLPMLQLADPGLDSEVPESSFFPRAPLFFAGYGDEDERHFAALGMCTGGQNIDVNVYDADGDHLQALDTTPLFSGQLYKVAAPVPEGAHEPHGNLRIEMHANGNGWTAGIGY